MIDTKTQELIKKIIFRYMFYNMKKASIIILSSLILFLLVSKSLTFADENGKGNEKKNENGAQVTFQEDTKTVENKKRAMESCDSMALFFVFLPVRGWTRRADNWYVAVHTDNPFLPGQ